MTTKKKQPTKAEIKAERDLLKAENGILKEVIEKQDAQIEFQAAKIEALLQEQYPDPVGPVNPPPGDPSPAIVAKSTGENKMWLKMRGDGA